MTLIKNIRISRHVGCWLLAEPGAVVTGKICSPAKNGLTNAVKLVNIFGWLGWQTRQKNVRQGDYYPRANDDKIFSSSLPHNSAPAASVGGRVHLSQPPRPKITINFPRLVCLWPSLQFWCLFAAIVSVLFGRTAKCWVWKADVMMSVILIVCSEFEIVNYRRVMNINTKLNSTHRHGCQSQNCWL